MKKDGYLDNKVEECKDNFYVTVINFYIKIKEMGIHLV